MKSPSELQERLRRQWENADTREYRLLGGRDAWPVVLSIGRPPATMIQSNIDIVREHIDAWRKVKTGKVVFKSVKYRSALESVEVPFAWEIDKPTQWIHACSGHVVRTEFESMAKLIDRADPLFHSLLVRRRSLWRDKNLDQAVKIAEKLSPGYAEGKPLRLLPIDGIDTKFFERHASLITALLDLRFDGEVSQIGLESFLDAAIDGDHWVMVVDLDGSLLPFSKQRVRSGELEEIDLPGEQLLIVENESCQYHLPHLQKTIAVLGTGFDLKWINGMNLSHKKVGYWGDIDTWGLHFLSEARSRCPHLDALMMTPEVFDEYSHSAVMEPVIASAQIPIKLNRSEQQLYGRLLKAPQGRLEQEFLPESLVHDVLCTWADSPSSQLEE